MKAESLLCSLGTTGALILLTAETLTGAVEAQLRRDFTPTQAVGEVGALVDLVSRTTPEYAGRVNFAIDEARPTPVISAWGDRGIQITAANVRECARAYGYYLRNLAHVHLSWNGDNRTAAHFVVPADPVQVPATLPMNFAFNYCALSYTGAHWSKERWLEEVDRLALNGFRYVLVTAGLEKVWQGFLADIGAEDFARDFLANPCYSAWWNMGNLEGEGGPVSAGLVESEAELGRSLVRRMLDLGMEPVLQGYVGHIPHDCFKGSPDVLPQGQWVGGYVRPAILRPDSPAFPKIAGVWYNNIRKVYGITPTAFAGDLFHEGGCSGAASLERCARSVQEAMQSAAPGSIWFLQAWAGNPKPVLLRGTDPRYTVILALEKNLSANQEVSRCYQGRPYVWCELANFGGKHGLFGGFGILEKAAGNAGGASGFGLLSEGIETNPLYYELFFERINNRSVINRDDFLRRTALSRYGSNAPELVESLKLLASSVYSPDGSREGGPENILCARPGWDVNKVSTWSDPRVFYDPEDVHRAGRLMLAAAKTDKRLMQSSGFCYDLADICRQVLADKARVILPQCKAAAGDAEKYTAKRNEFLELFILTANILATHESFLLGRYLSGAAKREAGTSGEMTRNLRRLITTWAPRITVLNDYAHRELSELMRYYYMPRWIAFLSNGEEAQARKVTVTNNGECVTISIREDAKLQSMELGFPDVEIPLLYEARGDLLKLAEQALK